MTRVRSPGPGRKAPEAAGDRFRRTLFEAAARAGVHRIVHVSITHPSLDSAYPYFWGKAQVERMLADSGVSYAIARPAILFGGEDVLVNNVAWLLRHLPVFAVGAVVTWRGCVSSSGSATTTSWWTRSDRTA